MGDEEQERAGPAVGDTGGCCPTCFDKEGNCLGAVLRACRPDLCVCITAAHLNSVRLQLAYVVHARGAKSLTENRRGICAHPCFSYGITLIVGALCNTETQISSIVLFIYFLLCNKLHQNVSRKSILLSF